MGLEVGGVGKVILSGGPELATHLPQILYAIASQPGPRGPTDIHVHIFDLPVRHFKLLFPRHQRSASPQMMMP